MKLNPFIEILRPFNCVIAGFATFIGYLISFSYFNLSIELLFLALASFFICGAGQAVNDFFDRDIDAKTKKHKVIPSKRMNERTAFFYSIFLFFVGVIFAFLVNFSAFIIALIFSILLFAYSAFMQKYKYIGNFIVAFGTGFTLIFGASVSGNYFFASILALSAVAANLGRELIKDIEDLKGDKGFKITLPQLLNLNSVSYLVFFYLIIAIISSYFPVIFSFITKSSNGFLSTPYILIITAANFLFVYSFRLLVKRSYSMASKFAKTAMFVALIGFLSSVFF